MNWDFLVGFFIIGLIILIAWAKVSKQTVADVIRDIKDMLTDRGEEVEERVGGIVEYE